MPTNTLALTRLLLTEQPSLMRLVQRIVVGARAAFMRPHDPVDTSFG
ncbi:MAG: hypothetical protein V4564_01100 [Pseudomonadota bacterium]